MRSLLVLSLVNVSDEEVKSQFREFLKRLEDSTAKMSIDELKSTDAKVLIKKFFDQKGKFYHGIEMIMQTISVASVQMPCESVLDSLVSFYENHFDARRKLNEEDTSEEFMIAVNGPNLAHSISIIKEAKDSYWKSKGSP